MANSVNYIPQIDYTSRDYTAIKNDLLNLIPYFAPNWTSRDPADFGMVLIDLFAYMGDMMSFYVDRAANEGFLTSASQRDSILELAAMLGYIPTTVSPATTTLTFTNSTSNSITIPALTQVANTTTVGSSSPQILFETDAAITLSANSSAQVTASQGFTVYPQGTSGQTNTEPNKVSTGAPNQVFALSQQPVIKNSIVVTIAGLTYSYIGSLLDAGMYDPVFTTTNDSTGVTYLVFGDGISGRVPAAGASISVQYRVGAGSAGNLSSGVLTYLPTAIAGVTVTNQVVCAGGADEESTDSIRINAPSAFRALNRAVSLSDYTSLALQVPGVAKASSDSAVYSNVNLYIVPFGDNGYASGTSGTTSSAFNALKTAVANYFLDKTGPNVSLNILPPTYVPIDLTVTVNVLPQFRQDLIVSQAYAAIRTLFTGSNSFFADRVTAQFIMYALASIAGIDYITINLVTRPLSVSYWSRTSNVVTLYYPTTYTAPYTANVTTVTVSNVDSSVNTATNASVVVTSLGTATVSGTLYNTITFANTGSNVTATAVTGGKVDATTVDTIICGSNEIPIEGTFTVNAVGGIY